MNARPRLLLTLALLLLAGLALVTVSGATPVGAPTLGGAPTIVSYQGEVRVGGVPYSGFGHFKFAIVDPSGSFTIWSNDGTSSGGKEPDQSVKLDVIHGLFSVLLGDKNLVGMTEPLLSKIFGEPNASLRVWFSTSGLPGTFRRLDPDTPIAAVPYALQAQEAADADTVDGLHARDLETHYHNVVVVAKRGGDHTTVQAAIDGITDAAAHNPYLVWVAPGVYVEQVTMVPHVHLQGAGQGATVISSTAGSEDFPPDQATLKLASDTSLRDLTVGNSGDGPYNAALLATAGTTGTLVAEVTARAVGDGGRNYAIVLNGSGTGLTLQQVTALAGNGLTRNEGLNNCHGAAAILRGGFFAGRGGGYAIGIQNCISGTTLDAEGVTALAEDGSSITAGLYIQPGAVATLRGGSFTARRSGYNASGITSYGTLEATAVTALGVDGDDYNYGLNNTVGAEATLRGGSFTGRGGATRAAGIYNGASTATLQASGIAALGEGSTGDNYGLYVHWGTLTADSSQFTGSTNALYQDHGTVHLGVCQLGGGHTVVGGGSLTCFQVYDGNYAAYTCP